jgi:competence protein ComEC
MAAAPPQLPVWSAPLVPVALGMTAGIVLDRFWMVPLGASLGATFVCVLAWLIFANTPQKRLALVYLWGGVAGFGATYHHWQRHHIDANDLSRYAEREPQPARLRGTLQTAPSRQIERRDPLRTMPASATSRFVVRATQRQDVAMRTWHDVGGLVQITVVGNVTDITVGDEVELLGRLALPGEAVNPGGFDYAAFLRDQGITTTLTMLESSEVTLVRRGWPTSFFGWLAVVRGWGQRTLQRDLGAQHEVAAALLLGEGSGMAGEEWDKYLQTGVIHVLAISGQHLVVLAGFLWLVVRVVGVRRRYAAPMIALFLIAYALLTGGRPPVMRAAWVVAAYAGGILLQRPVCHANTFALGWIGVILINPTDIFGAGCQLSFLAVAVLVWGVRRWAEERPQEPIERLIDRARSWPATAWIQTWRWIFASYAVNAVVTFAVAPLVASHYHTVTPIALLIGPPMVLLTSLALLSGFAFLLFSWFFPLAWLFAAITQLSLYGCELFVTLGHNLPGAYFFVADVPTWWLWVFYMSLLIGITSQFAWRYPRRALAVALGWLAFGVLLQLWPHRPGELRCTFVAVGHGGCTVIETPDGRVFVYDAGSIAGSDVTRRHIAPFLWSRGIRRIDALLLSHGDLDHFNGVPQLAERFAIGRVISTPTFTQRENAGMQKTLLALDRHGLEVEVVTAGQRWQEDGVLFTVLHPPLIGPTKNENARSLVLLVKHGNWSMLLTGDLEGEGLTQVLAQPPPPIDVLMAPHHGSETSNNPALAQWARPKLVVSCQTEPKSERKSVRMYEKMGAKFLGTWPHGAITLRPAQPDAAVETFQTKLAFRPF